jgi:hypothetical protein
MMHFNPPPPFPPPEQSGLKLVCTVNIVYGNLKSENSQDKSQKPPQQNCTFMNSASESIYYGCHLLSVAEFIDP